MENWNINVFSDIKAVVFKLPSYDLLIQSVINWNENLRLRAEGQIVKHKP